MMREQRLAIAQRVMESVAASLASETQTTLEQVKGAYSEAFQRERAELTAEEFDEFNRSFGELRICMGRPLIKEFEK